MNGPNRPLLPLVLVASLAAPSLAQDSVPPLRVLAESFRDAARARLEEPAAHERVGEDLREGRWLRLLEGVDLDLRAFEGGKDGDLALGVGIEMAKVLRPSLAEEQPAIELLFEGLVASEQERNVDDSLAATVRLRWAGSRTLGRGESRSALADALEVPAVEDLRALDGEAFERLAARFEPANAAALASDPDFAQLAQRHFERLAPRLAHELAWAFDAHAALETDQDFSSRQVALGGSLAGRLVSWDPRSKASRYDVFDLPAACLRWLAGEDERFRLSGTALPSVVAGLDVVDAARDEGRGALTDDETYLRLRLELELASLAFHVDERPLQLSARWRFFQELDAPGEVRAAGTDDSSHLELRLAFRRGWFLSWSGGELPLDPRYDSTLALGYAIGL